MTEKRELRFLDESLEVTSVKAVIYTVLLTVVFLVFGLAVHELLHLQRFISLEVSLLLEGLTVICFGEVSCKKVPDVSGCKRTSRGFS